MSSVKKTLVIGVSSLTALGILLFAAQHWLIRDSIRENAPATLSAPAAQPPVEKFQTRRPMKGSGSADREYLGSESCAGCHQDQFQAWQQSHHDQAMQHAGSDTVKGNFNNAGYSHAGQDTLFYRQDKDYYVRTEGPGGTPEEYKILYTFGTTPLQQYIVGFPDGKLQMLPIAWDTEANRWFHLQASTRPNHLEWIHWTQGGMNWNSMCADCHTTNLEKNYDPGQNGYATTWSGIDVGCEACHGPGQKHLEKVSDTNYKPGTEDTGIDMSVSETPRVIVEKCGRCHSRRQQLTPVFRHDSSSLLDHYLPTVLRSGLYHSDGQILDEVFVYSSFLQSKMYHNNVSCIDCHEPHSVKLRADGNALCTGCHVKDQYDSPSHHHHAANTGGTFALPQDSQGNQCVDCHMPGRIYMGNDFRRDHSFRVPRPDLSVAHGTPNACNSCHSERDPEWALAAVEAWFGEQRQPHFSETLTRFADQPEQALTAMLTLLQDSSSPAIARATAAYMLTPWMNSSAVRAAMLSVLEDADPLVRTLAAQAYVDLPMPDKIRPLINLLKDPVRSVRISAASGLIEAHPAQIPPQMQQAYDAAKQEYRDSLDTNAEYPSGQHQIALNHQKLGQLSQAERAYLKTLEIDDHFNVARLNLAQLYYQQGRPQEAAGLYRKIIEQEPDASPAHYSLGLLMAELGDYQQAEKSLTYAAEQGANPRAWYNLAVLRQQRQKPEAAESAYLQALEIEPANIDYISGLFSLYAQQQQWQSAQNLISQALKQHPKNSELLRLNAIASRFPNEKQLP